MNFNPICVYDYETASRNKANTQIIEIAAMIIHSRKLEIVDKFIMTVQPEWDQEGCDEETIKWHSEQRGITYEAMVEILKAAPKAEIAWKAFTAWVDKYNYGKPGKTSYKAPIACGYNIDGFDSTITDRYCVKYGPMAKDKFLGVELPRLFNQVYTFDIMKHMWFWFENIEVGKKEELQNMQLGTLAKYMGVPDEVLNKTHAADTDVLICAHMALKLLNMERHMTGFKPSVVPATRRLQMKGCFVDKFPTS
jgi:DNA polymerase III epsilon subunit-like protein